MLVGDFAETTRLQMLGHTVHAVCPGKKRGEKVRTTVHDFGGDQTYTQKPGHNFTLNASFDDIGSSYDALLIPGGRAPEYLRPNKRVLKAIRRFASERKPIAAVCHGAQLLAAAGVIKGRRACVREVSFPRAFCDIAVDDGVTDAIWSPPAWHAHPNWLAQLCASWKGLRRGGIIATLPSWSSSVSVVITTEKFRWS